MGNPLDWRRIEAELEQIARSNGFKLDRNNVEDIIIDINEGLNLENAPTACYIGPELNLTSVAKELADRLGGK